jgi:hypothetical protein
LIQCAQLLPELGQKGQPQPAPPGCGLSTSLQPRNHRGHYLLEECAIITKL